MLLVLLLRFIICIYVFLFLCCVPMFCTYEPQSHLRHMKPVTAVHTSSQGSWTYREETINCSVQIFSQTDGCLWLVNIARITRTPWSYGVTMFHLPESWSLTTLVIATLPHYIYIYGSRKCSHFSVLTWFALLNRQSCRTTLRIFASHSTETIIYQRIVIRWLVHFCLDLKKNNSKYNMKLLIF